MCGLLELLCPCLKKTEEDYDIIPEQGNYHGGRDFTGARDGFGIYQFRNGDIYEGSWKKDKKHGLGEYRFRDGKILKGYFENDKFIGEPPSNSHDLARTKSPQPLKDADIVSTQRPVKVNENNLSYTLAKTVGHLKKHVKDKHNKKHKKKDQQDHSAVSASENQNLIASQHYTNNMYTGEIDPEVLAQMERERNRRQQERIAKHRELTEKIRKKYNIKNGKYTYA